MKNFTFLFIALLLLIAKFAYAQPDAVQLKTGSGALLGSYNSVTSAYAAIPSALAEAYIIELQSGYTGANETYPVSFTSKTGASTANTITVRPAAGVVSVSMITSLATTTSAVFILNDADYVIIDGRPGGTGATKALTIGNTATNSNTVQLINGACFDTVRYCILQNGSTGSAGRAIHLSTSATNTTGNSDNYFAFNAIAGSRYGANTNGTAANPNTRNTFYGCEFQNVIFTGIWWQAGSGMIVVDSCLFTCSAGSSTTPYGILFDSQTDAAIITRNRFIDIRAAGTSAVRGIYIRSTAGTSYSLIANNFIAFTSANTSSTSVIGILYEGTVNTRADIYYNSVRIGSTLTSGGTSGNVVSAGFVKSHSGTGDEFNISNNIFVNERTGGASGTQHVALSLTNTNGTFNMDNNTYNSNSGQLNRYSAVVYNDVASWKTAVAPNDVNANAEPVSFVSLTDLHLSGSSVGNANLNAAPMGNITVDIDNEIRSAGTHYRGADENTAFPLPVNLVQLWASQYENMIVLGWRTYGERDNFGFEVQRSLNGREFSAIGFVAGSGNSNVPLTYSFADVDIPGAAKLYYRLKQTDKDGRTNFSPVCVVTFDKTDLTVRCYPNPFAEDISVNISTERKVTARLRLINAYGVMIRDQKLQLAKGSNTFMVNLPAGLSAGIYFLKIAVDGNESITRLLKQ